MYIANNIDLLQINLIPGQTEYYLPTNVSWNGKCVDKMVVIPSIYNQAVELSPVDGQTQLASISNDCFIDLYAEDSSTIFNSLWIGSLSITNEEPIIIGRKLSLNLSKIYFTTPIQQSTCLLIAVFYDGKEVDEYPALESLTVQFPMYAMQEISLQDIVDNYIHIKPNKIKGIDYWYDTLKQRDDYMVNGIKPIYLNLQTIGNKNIFRLIPGVLCLPQILTNYFQVHPMRFNNIDVDMLRSTVVNGVDEQQTVTLTFYY